MDIKMSRTYKDLKSHKKGFGRFGFNKPKRKLRPFIYEANKIAGDNEVLAPNPNWKSNISQDDFNKTHWYGAKSVRNIRKRAGEERKDEKSRARTKIKRHDKKNLL
jgi:hypothetical protein